MDGTAWVVVVVVVSGRVDRRRTTSSEPVAGFNCVSNYYIILYLLLSSMRRARIQIPIGAKLCSGIPCWVGTWQGGPPFLKWRLLYIKGTAQQRNQQYRLGTILFSRPPYNLLLFPLSVCTFLSLPRHLPALVLSGLALPLKDIGRIALTSRPVCIPAFTGLDNPSLPHLSITRAHPKSPPITFLGGPAHFNNTNDARPP